MIKKFKGLVRVIPSNLVSAVIGSNVHVADVDDPIDMIKRKGIIVLKVPSREKILINKWADSLKSSKDYPNTNIDVELIIKGKHRTLSQNSLYWALINVLAMEVYHEQGWEEEIHEAILSQYAPKIKERLYGKEVSKRSKDMDTSEFTRLIEGVFYEINQIGVELTEPADLQQYWNDYSKIRFSNGKDYGYREGESLQDYRYRVNYCEACRKYLRAGSDHYDGEIAHIVSRGASGEDETWNVLHLCHEHHIAVQHQKGWNEFLRQFPHLTEKVRIAHEMHDRSNKNK